MKPINLSFAACGFLGIYHLGAASALCKHGGKLLKDVKAFAGASAGSLVASVLLTAPQKIEECNKFTYDFAEEIRRQSFGALTPGYDFMARLRSGVESILPANAHELAHGRLHVSITNSRTGRNCLASSFPSREDLVQFVLVAHGIFAFCCNTQACQLRPVSTKLRCVVSSSLTRDGSKAACTGSTRVSAAGPPGKSDTCVNSCGAGLSDGEGTLGSYLLCRCSQPKSIPKVLLASSFLPIYAGLKPVEYKGQKWVDGSFTNSLPILPVGRTVTISPFSGRLDVSPQDKGRLHFYLSVTNQEVLLSVANLVRLNRALFPPSRRTMESLYQWGFDDASRFLLKESWFE
ncbi:patatin-like phospholipase domain-containing protein 4 isoform X2 [Ovis canadensis]|uniref:patatin-like phospholipase domain-containing protein 4 isoform X2 n=1 Tax=Ovis canadensis TaxID=37174 RepID=UPI00375262C7